jgi:hypothetical protein
MGSMGLMRGSRNQSHRLLTQMFAVETPRIFTLIMPIRSHAGTPKCLPTLKKSAFFTLPGLPTGIKSR